MGKGSKNLSKNNRQLATINDNEKLHYRMYKSGKTWLFAGIATFSLGLVFLGAPNVHADTTSETTQTTATTSSTSTTDTTTATETPAAEATTGSTTGGQTSSTSTSEDTDGVTAADDATAVKGSLKM